MNSTWRFPAGLRGLRAVARWVLPALSLLFLLPSCGDQVAPGPTPTPDPTFNGNFDPNSGELEFAVSSPGGGVEPFLRLVASDVSLDPDGLLHAHVAIRNTGTESVPGPAGVLVSNFQPASVYPVNAACPEPIPVPGDTTQLPPISWPQPSCFFDHRGTYGDDGLLATGETSAPVEWIFGGTQGQSFAFHAQLVTEPVPEDGVIAGVVFEDRNENGLRDWNEPGIPGVGVRIEPPDVARVPVTDEQGRYRFDVPEAGLYTLTLIVPEGARPTTPVQLQVLIVVRDGKLSSFLDANFGLVKTLPGELFVEGVVFMDHNRNGIRERGEEGVAQVGVNASGLECMLPVIGITYTDATGYYEISSTSVGCPLPWLVQRLPVAGHIGTTPDQVILQRLPPDGTMRMRVNFGIAPEDSTHPVNVTIRGVVFADHNLNGVRDADEEGIDGVQIQLVSPCDVFRATMTDSGGYYSFPPDVVRMCTVTGVWQWMPMYPLHTTPNPVEIEMPTVPGNHLLRVDFGIGFRRDW